jgi:hypothetical protein
MRPLARLLLKRLEIKTFVLHPKPYSLGALEAMKEAAPQIGG